MNTLSALAAAWKHAKEEEQRAVEARRSIEEQMLGLLPVKDEGTVSEDTDAGKLVVTYKVSRSVDTESLQNAWQSLNENARSIFKWSADISIKEMRAAQSMNYDAYKQAAQFITSKPAKPSFAIK